MLHNDYEVSVPLHHEQIKMFYEYSSTNLDRKLFVILKTDVLDYC